MAVGVEKVPINIGDIGYAISIIGSGARNIRNALWQFPKNSMEANATKVTIELYPKDKVIVVTDDGDGMDEETIRYVPQNICRSLKRFLDNPGTGHGIGIIEFMSFAESLTIFSRARDSQTTWALELKAKDIRENRLEAEIWLAPASYRLLSSGTCVKIYGVHSEAFNSFRIKGLVSYYSSHAELALSQRNFRLIIREGKHTEEVKPGTIPGQKIPLDSLPFKYSGRQGEIQFYLVITPSRSEKVRLVSPTGETVIPDITELPQFNHPPWNDSSLAGRITYLGDQTATREGVVKNPLYYHWAERIQTHKDFISQQLQAVSSRRTQARDQKIYELVYNAINQAINEMELYFRRHTPREKRTRVVEVIREKDTKRKDEGKVKGVVVEREGTRRIHQFPKLTFDETTPVSRSDLHSEFDPTLSTIYVNTQHPDYLAECGQPVDPERKYRYLLKLATIEVANHCFQGLPAKEIAELAMTMELIAIRNTTFILH